MAADVSSLLRLLNSYKNDQTAAKESTGAKSTAALMTRDLLGSGGDRSLELDLDLQVPTGYEKRLDLKSGKVYLQRCDSATTSSSEQSNQTVPTFQDLNFPPATTKPLLNLFDETTPCRLDNNFNSVCTLDKVKSALERAEKNKNLFKKRQSPEYSDSGDLQRRRTTTEEIGSPVAAGCSGCLSYVLVMRNNPKCPRCDSVVTLPANSIKKPKIDLNISI